ncbi:MAG: Holliday junction branch migration protein RuvA [Chloroflexi bacterium]|nr:Holliday junction branch migration protein RuvA [Chloroflexota bacterium]
MIAFLRGRLLSSSAEAIVVEVGGVGFRLQVTEGVRRDLPRLGQAVELHTHMSVRENDITLYGFSTAEELALFDVLLGVSGVGPRTALSMLSVFSPEGLRDAIGNGDIAALTRAPGVGRKTAQRLLLDLRDRLGPFEATAGEVPRTSEDEEVVSALTSLGYSQAEAQAALAGVAAEVQGLDNRILSALRNLSGR